MRTKSLVTIVLLVSLAGFAAAQTPPTPGTPPKSTDPSKPTPPAPPTEIAGESLDQWIKKLKSYDASARDAALKVIPIFGDPARKAVKSMIPLIIDPDNTVKVTAMLMLSSLPIEDKEERESIIRKLRDHIQFTGGIIRLHACVCVAQPRLATEADSCIPALAIALKDMSSFEIRKAAAQALGQIGAPDDINGPNLQALSALINQLTDPALAVRVEVVQSLIILGPPRDEKLLASEKSLLLSRMKTESDKTLPIWLRVCFMRLDPTLVTEENISFISKSLKDPKLRMAAAEALGYLGRAAKSRLFDLMEGLKSDKLEDIPFMLVCMSTISNMGTEAIQAKAELEKLANHKNEIIKLNAQQALEYVTGKKKL